MIKSRRVREVHRIEVGHGILELDGHMKVVKVMDETTIEEILAEPPNSQYATQLSFGPLPI